MQITLDWQEAIELGTSTTLRDNIKNFDLKQIPQITGIYLFYRETRSEDCPQEVLYIGQTVNMRTRMKQHFNSLGLIEWLEDTPQGKKCLIFAELKTRGMNNIERALNQAEKGLIQHFIENDHPLLNRKLMADHFDEILSKGNTLEILEEDIYVYSTRSNKDK